MLFRAADKDCSNVVAVDYFRSFLMRLRLGLSQSQISRIIYLCDEECTGVIRRDEFYNCLAAYEVNQETTTYRNNRSFG
jgi:Ca2+-binding EF-hand superfamily protein